MGSRLAAAAAWVLGPGLAWYWLNSAALSTYVWAQQMVAEPVGAAQAVGWTWLVLAGLFTGAPFVVILGMLCAPWSRRPGPTMVLLLTGLLTVHGLMLSGTPALFTSGSVATRLLLGPVCFLSLAGGVVLATLPARLWFGMLLVALMGISQWSFRLAPCGTRRHEVAILRVCSSGSGLRWRALGGSVGKFALPELPGTETIRITAVVSRQWLPGVNDESHYLRSLFDRHRAVTVVNLDLRELPDWISEWGTQFDDLVLLGGVVDEARGMRWHTPLLPLVTQPGTPQGALIVGPLPPNTPWTIPSSPTAP